MKLTRELVRTLPQEKPFQCEVTFFTRNGVKDTDLADFTNLVDAQNWCDRQKSFKGFYKAWINDKEYKI